MKPNHMDRFILALRKMNGAEIAGVARMLNIKLTGEAKEDEKPETRSPIAIMTDMVEAFMSHPRRGRRRLLKIMEDAASAPRENISVPESDEK